MKIRPRLIDVKIRSAKFILRGGKGDIKQITVFMQVAFLIFSIYSKYCLKTCDLSLLQTVNFMCILQVV
jgi:hypothetical protein